MANRYPLIIDTADGNKIKELPADDNLYLRNNSILDVQDINALGTINAAAITIAGQQLVAQSFTDLTDTPNSYSSAANNFLKVNSSGTGIEFVTLSALGSITVDNITIASNGDIIPAVSNVSDIGSLSQRFSKVYSTSFYGSLRGYDGTLVFDATNNRISYAAIFGAPTALSEFTNDMGFLDSAGIELAINAAIAGTNFDTDLTGSVFGDDSTLLVDGVNSVLKTHALERVGATDGQALVWSDANQRWQPGTITGGGGGGVDLTAFSVAAEGVPSGNGALSYDNLTGEFTYTPPDLANLGDFNAGNITADSITANSLEFTGAGVVTIESGSNLILNAANGAGNIIASGSRITNVADPIGLQDAATKSYVDAVFLGGGVAFYEGDMKGSVFGNDSSLIIDGNNNQLYIEKIIYGDNAVRSYQDGTSCPPTVDTVIYTSSENMYSLRLFVMVQGRTDSSPIIETQACDVVAVRGYTDDTVSVSIYGLTYSSAGPLATFDGQWNALTNKMEITCQPTSGTYLVTTSAHGLEIQTNN